MKTNLYSRSIIRNLILLIIIIFVVMTTAQVIYNINLTNKELESNMKVIVNGLEDRLGTIDRLYRLIENQIDEVLENKLNEIVSYYNTNKILDPNLEKYKTDSFMDFYIIDENYVVIHTTFPTDLGLDLGENEVFQNYLDKVKEKQIYMSDRVTPSNLTSKIKKYSYFSSEDRKYIFEVSYDFSAFEEMLGEDNIMNLVSDAFDEAQSIESLRVLDLHGNSYSDDYKISKENEARYLKYNSALAEGVNQEHKERFEVLYNRYTFYYPFIPSDKTFESPTFVIEIIYTNAAAIERLISQYILQVFILVSFIIILLILFRIYNKRFIKPLSLIIEKMNQVSINQDYSNIDIAAKNELKILAETFNTMFERINKDYKTISSHNQLLDEKVKQRTLALNTMNDALNDKIKELESSQKRILSQERTIAMNQVLQEVNHRVNTPIGNAKLYLSFLKDEINDDKKRSMIKINEGLDNTIICLNTTIEIFELLSHVYNVTENSFVKSVNLKTATEIIITQKVKELIVSFSVIVKGDEFVEKINLEHLELVYGLLLTYSKNNIKGDTEAEIILKSERESYTITFTAFEVFKEVIREANPFEPLVYGTFKQGIEGLELYILKNLVEIQMKGQIDLNVLKGNGIILTFHKSSLLDTLEDA